MNGTHPIPAPSLRELSSESETEGVSPDEWKTPFVGAMKIARNLLVSGRYVEWYSPIPAPSLRELLSAAKLRECTSMNVTAQKFQSQYELVGKTLAQSNHRGTLPQSALAGCQLPQRGSRDNIPHNVNHPSAGYFVSGRVIFGGFCVGEDILPFNRVLAKPWGWRAIFIAPTKL